jgi:hypothetical protein
MSRKISQLSSAADVTANDLIQVVDIEDPLMANSGTNKKCTAQLMANELGKLTNITATGSTTARTLANRFADVVNVKDFGAVGNDVTDDTAAIQAAIDSLSGAKGGIVFFPAGLYKTTSTINVKKDLIWLVGANTNASAIRVYHDNGAGVNVEHPTSPGSSFINGFGISNMMIRARVLTTSNAALVLNKVQSVYLTNLVCSDHFGGVHARGGALHYCTNLSVTGPRASAPVSWTGPQAGSFFYKLSRSSDGSYPFEIFVSTFNFRFSEPNINYIDNGIVISAVDGVWFDNGHIMGCDNANVLIAPESGTEQITGIRFNNCWLDNNSSYGIRISGATSSQFGVVELSQTRFLTPTAHAIFVESSAADFGGITMNGGVIHKAGFFGMLIRAGKQYIINGVEFAACNTSGTANTAAISVQEGVDNVIISSCQFTQTQSSVTAPLMQGVRISPDSSSQINVTGCNFNLDAESLDISDASTSDRNIYLSNTTTKTTLLDTVTSSVLDVPEIGEVFYVSDALNFNNLSGRWHGRKITLVFAGICTVTHSSGGIRLAGGANFVSKNGDTLSMAYLSNINDWIETGRMVS